MRFVVERGSGEPSPTEWERVGVSDEPDVKRAVEAVASEAGRYRVRVEDRPDEPASLCVLDSHGARVVEAF
jgi:hypothetical protein